MAISGRCQISRGADCSHYT